MPNNDYDRYVTWAIDVPEGVTIPHVDQWTLPVWFPDPTTYYPKNFVPIYAIRNPYDVTVFTADDSAQVFVPQGAWYCFNDPNTFIVVPDDYFWGSVPDTSGGTVFPPELIRDLPVDPPPWTGDPNPPGGDGDPNTPDSAPLDGASEPDGEPVTVVVIETAPEGAA